jgi:tetratricopeptide (TPR) repeat protein
VRPQRDDARLEADVVGNLGLIAFADGAYDTAHRLYAESLALHRQIGSQIGVVQQLLNLGSVCLVQQQWRDVVRLMGEGLALARTIGYTQDRPYGLHVMAQAHLALRELAAARSCCESALALIDDGAERLQRPIVLAVLCEVELADGRLDVAADTLREAALAARQGALAHDQVSVIQAWASLLLAQQRVAETAILWSRLATHGATLATQRATIRADLARLRDRLPEDVFAACERKAATLQLETLLTQAASLLAPTP